MADSTNELQDALTDASRTQFAAVTSAVAFWSAWAESAAGYARGMTDELANLSGGDADSGDVIGRIGDLNQEYLRKVTELPKVAVDRFNEELEKIEAHRSRSRKTAKPQRRAKAKP